MANQVKLTFAGEGSQLAKTFDDMGSSAKKMSDDVESSSKGFERAGEAADEVDTKAMGFRDTLTGVQDTMGGLAALSKGPSFDAFLQLGAGIGDLGSGFYNLLIPALEKTKLATVASTVATNIASAATKAWTAAQRLMNLAFVSSPIGWIVLGITALIAVVVLIATKTNWFQRLWSTAWRAMKTSAENTWNWIKKIPGWVTSAFKGIGNAIAAPFKGAFNAVARAWNSTVGQLSWSVPGWVPGIGGNSIGVPKIPTFHAGTGVVPGVPGTPTVALLQAGESVGSIASTARGADGGGWLVVKGDQVIDSLIEAIAQRVDRRGGKAIQLGVRVV